MAQEGGGAAAAVREGEVGGEEVVPLIVVKMLEGRSVEQKRRLVREITDVVTRLTDAPEDQVDVIIEDHARENWAKAGQLYCDK